MADGYGFGAEGDWKTSALVRLVKVMATGLPGGTSFMEDYTYDLDPGRAERPRGAHARGLPDDRGRPRRAARSTRCRSARDPTRSGSSSTRRPVRRSWPGMTDLGDRFRIVANVIDIVGSGAAPAAPAGRPGRLAAAARPADRGRVLADRRWRASHGPDPGHRSRAAGRLRGDGGHRVRAHRRKHDRAGLPQGAPLERGLPPPDPDALAPVTAVTPRPGPPHLGGAGPSRSQGQR